MPQEITEISNWLRWCYFNPLSANFTKWSDTFKQFVSNLPTNCLSVFDHFVGLALKGLRINMPNGKTHKCKLSNVLYVPDLSHNLLIVSKAASNGKSFELGQSHWNILDNKFGVIATATKCGNLYYLNCTGSNLTVKENHTAMKCASTDWTKKSIWHRRYGHLGAKIWNKLQRNNWLMDLIIKQRRNQVFVNHVLMVSRLYCHFPRQKEKGQMNSLVIFSVIYVERLRQSHLVEQNTLHFSLIISQDLLIGNQLIQLINS